MNNLAAKPIMVILNPHISHLDNLIGRVYAKIDSTHYVWLMATNYARLKLLKEISSEEFVLKVCDWIEANNYKACSPPNLGYGHWDDHIAAARNRLSKPELYYTSESVELAREIYADIQRAMRKLETVLRQDLSIS